MTTAHNNLRVREIIPGIFIALLLGMGPYLLAWAMTPDGARFSGILANHNDFTAYIAAMRQGAEGKWLFHFNFSPEYWAPQLMLPIYIVVGKLVSPIGGSYEFWFNVMRALAIIFTTCCFLLWARQVFPKQRERQLVAWIFMTFGAGFGWILWPIFAYFSFSFTSFPDINTPEWTTTLVSINPPHYMLGLGLETLLFTFIIRMTRLNSPVKWAIGGSLVGLLLGLIYVYLTAVVGMVIGIYMLIRAWQARRIPWRQWIYGGIVILPLIPLLFYYGYWVNRDPAWASYVKSDINIIGPPPVLGAMIGLGFLGVLMLIGLRSWFRNKQHPLPFVWIVVNLFLLYVPIVQYSGRFALGLIIPIATIAAYSLQEVLIPWLKSTGFYTQFSRLTPTPAASLRRILIIFVVPSAFMVSLFSMQYVVLNRDYPIYLPTTELEAAAWLANNSDDNDLILSDYPIGNYLPSIDNTRVFFGQFFLTLHFDEKEQQVLRFWDAQTPDSWREEFIREWNITHVYQGQFEKDLINGEINIPGQIIYQTENVTIYDVSELSD